MYLGIQTLIDVMLIYDLQRLYSVPKQKRERTLPNVFNISHFG